MAVVVDHCHVRLVTREEVVTSLQRVRGIGENLASTLFDRGVRTIKDLLRREDVSHAIRLCARYVDDIEQTIPRKMVKAFFDWMNATFLGEGEVMLVGSFRRGKTSTHDIDLLFIDPPLDLSRRVEKAKGFIATLSSGEWSFDTLIRIGGKVRVVEIYKAPSLERGAALLHTTGPALFNIILRKKAKVNGMLLSQHGLFRDEKLLAAKSEEDIMAALDIPFVRPEDRDDYATDRIEKAS